MKQAATIFFLVLIISTHTQLGQLFKLPLLIEHYIKHQKQNGVSLLDFLAEHYASNHRDADLHEDEQLPFKNITMHSNYAIVTPFNQTFVSVRLPAGQKVSFTSKYIPQQYLDSIFHPPKV